MLLGEYNHTLDPKGRLVLPSKFREDLADGCVITKGQERCLYVFPLTQWEIEEARVRALPRTDQRARRYSRAFFASADSQGQDKQGRVQVNQKLRDYAGLQKEVTIVGVSDRLEIWDTATWDRLQTEADEYYAGIEEAFSEYGI